MNQNIPSDMRAKLERAVYKRSQLPKQTEGSYVRNCLFDGKPGEDLFTITLQGEWIARLDGYAIIPIEKYEILSGNKGPSSSR